MEETYIKLDENTAKIQVTTENTISIQELLDEKEIYTKKIQEITDVYNIRKNELLDLSSKVDAKISKMQEIGINLPA